MMEFGWINLFGAVILIIMMIPNIIYAIKDKDSGKGKSYTSQNTNKSIDKAMNIIEQLGRYGCIILMWLPLFVRKFGFPSADMLLIYILGNGLLLLSYMIFWILYFKRKTAIRTMALAIIPPCIFLMSGLSLSHWTLVVFAILFGLGHIYVTIANNQWI